MASFENLAYLFKWIVCPLFPEIIFKKQDLRPEREKTILLVFPLKPAPNPLGNVQNLRKMSKMSKCPKPWARKMLKTEIVATLKNLLGGLPFTVSLHSIGV